MKKILVIDDDQIMAETVEEVLSPIYKVAVETNNSNILDIYQTFRPDLIILDNWVGQKNADEIMNELRTLMFENPTPFVLFSGHPDVSKIAASIQADDWLAKPFTLNALYNCINNLLN